MQPQKTLMLVAVCVGLCSCSNERAKSERLACRNNLIQMDGATCSWALENRKGPNDSPTKSQLFGNTAYVRTELRCPAGGVYTLGSPSKPPTCSISGHQIKIDPQVWKESVGSKKRYLDDER